jgi:hypothetical protein
VSAHKRKKPDELIAGVIEIHHGMPAVEVHSQQREHIVETIKLLADHGDRLEVTPLRLERQERSSR